MRVVLTKEAKADFNEIFDYIAERNVDAALRFADKLSTNYQELSANPKAYPLVPNYRHHGIRRRAIRNYLIFYRIDASTITVLHIFHGSRDYERLLFPDE